MIKNIYVVDAFTSQKFSGNQAGVVPGADDLDDRTMQAIAREVNASETAFFLKTKTADLKLRFFTPFMEVPFCGHAFVASVALAMELKLIDFNGDFINIMVETKAGRHPTEVRREGGNWFVEMTQADPAFKPVNVPADSIASALGISVDDIDASLPIELAYTGLWHLVVPVTSPQTVRNLIPDYKKLKMINDHLGVQTTHVFCKEGADYATRGLAPSAGVDEDPVTGSASGAFGAYLVKNSQVAPGARIVLSQRDKGGRGGLVYVRVDGSPDKPGRVRVGGSAVIAIAGELL